MEDEGAGIPAELKATIFERFVRGPEADSASGSGLGLAIAKQIVERHGGEIWEDGQVGAGSRFRFTLPAALGDLRPEV